MMPISRETLTGFGGEYFPDPEDHEGNLMASKGDKALLQGYKSVLNSKNTEESLVSEAPLAFSVSSTNLIPL